MADHEDKPLPQLPLRSPQGHKLGALTVEARAHLRRLILQALEEEGIAVEREKWASAVKKSLYELGDSIERGAWLPGLKRARTILTRQRNEEKSRRIREQVEKELEEEEKAKLKQGKGPVEFELAAKRSASDHGSARDRNDTNAIALKQLRELVSTYAVQPVPKPSAKHLLLIADSFGSPVGPQSDDVHYGPAHHEIGCAFVADAFALGHPDIEEEDRSRSVILYGLDEWNGHLYDKPDEYCIQIVGGTFRLTGAISSAQHASLCKVIRLSIYVYLSLVLEQQLLANSHVHLNFPSLAVSRPTVPLSHMHPGDRPATPDGEKRRAKRDNTVAGGLWSFFTRKTETLLNRATSVGPSLVRSGSLELPLSRTQPVSAPRSSADGAHQRQRRYSFASTNSSRSPRDSDDVSRQRPFLTALRQVESLKDILSTTPGLALPLPSVLVDLAQREKQDPSRRLTGDEKAALSSMLGWEGKAAMGKGMAGLPGFIRHQGLSVLYSAHVPMPLVSLQLPTPSGSTSTSSNIPAYGRFTSCGTRRKWVTYRYYQRDGEADETLGEMIARTCSTAEERCDKPDCHFKHADHDMRWIHGGVRIVATVGLHSAPEDKCADGNAIMMCESCAICGKQSRSERMFDGTYLLSFGKYLEMLIYSPAICVLTPPLCEHTNVPSRPWPAEDTPLPRSRLNIHRRFTCKSRTVTFSLSTVDDIFELRVPRLQILRRRASEKGPESDEAVDQASPKTPAHDDRRILRREIMGWWQGLSDHIDQIEENFASDDQRTRTKSLPRLPSEDDDFDEADLSTPKAPMLRLPSTSSATPTVTSVHQDAPSSAHFTNSSASSDSVMSTKSNSSAHETDSMSLLSGLRHAFQREEQILYAELSRTPTTSLNDVRRSFLTAARGASRRLSAWETKHLAHLPKGSKKLDMSHAADPEWWKAGCHAVPGGNIIVREDDWGSIISFTLSSLDYQHELACMSNPTSRHPGPHVPPPTPIPSGPLSTPSETRHSYFIPGSSFRKLLSGNHALPDPDQDGIVWQEPETYSAVISRKEHPRDPTSIMSFREVLRHKASTDGTSSPTPSKIAGAGGSNAKGQHSVPPSARAKPAVELSMEAADGQLSGGPETADKILHDLEAHSNLTSSWHSSASDAGTSNSGFVETNIRRGKTASIISADSDATTAGANSDADSNISPPPLPPKEPLKTSANATEMYLHADDESMAGTPSSFTTSLTNTFASAMRYMLKPGDVQRPSSGAPHHGLLSTDSPAIDERPHIKYDWTIGKRLKFSCTVYYAKQFDALRKRCGIDDVFLRSLARSENWAADGGKSRSNFWKTTDEQFIIKTLVNAWNVADLQVLIELGPSYFRHMDATATKPSVLAKLLGFYTIEIRNLESGTTQAKADLLVMENLFYNQKISKTFDLKGIQGRKVKASNSTSKTLFDGEWIEDQRRTLTLVRPYSKVVFQEAIKADCDYLARSNIMDYSLLLGINDESKHIACGLVDTIGSYTFAKTLEYKAKQGLNSGKEVTVVPPHEYQERFVNAMDDYFLACPDKWSKPLDDTRIPHDYRQLPSVL